MSGLPERTEEQQFRSYEDAPERVVAFYRDNHREQTHAVACAKAARFAGLNERRMSAWDALIEIDDRSHDPGKDRERDAMTARAGYHTLRIPAGASPTVQTVLGFVGDLRDGAASAAYQG